MNNTNDRQFTNKKLYSFVLNYTLLYTLLLLIAPNVSAGYVVSVSGLDTVRVGDNSNLLVTVYNNNSIEEVVLNTIEIFDEKGNFYAGRKFYLPLKPLAPLFEKQKQLIEASRSDNANLALLAVEWNKTKMEIQNNTIHYGISFNILKLDYSKDNASDLNITVYLTVNGQEMVYRYPFRSRKTEPLPEVFEDENGNAVLKEIAVQGVIPVTGWYAGDRHVHSKYSYPETSGELEISYIKGNASSKGLSWFTLTDHSPFVNDGWSTDEWDNMGLECSVASTSDFKCIRGLEIGGDVSGIFCTNKKDHYLAYPKFDSLSSVFVGI